MARSLEDAKEQLRHSFLGKDGIHGVGLSRAKQAIQVYVHSVDDAKQSALLEQLRQSAAPFPVIVIPEDRPQST